MADAIDRKHLLVAGFAIMVLASATMLLVTAMGAATYAAAAAIVMVSGSVLDHRYAGTAPPPG